MNQRVLLIKLFVSYYFINSYHKEILNALTGARYKANFLRSDSMEVLII